MPINMLFAPDLVLRNYLEFEKGNKKELECIPNNLKEGAVYSFLKVGQRAYWLDGEQPLLMKKEEGSLSAPIASILILEVTHFKENDVIYTKGKYKVLKILKKNEVYFNGCEPIKEYFL
ncbi:MAG: hypothetical protein JXA94_03235 [Parachlamydiales bacterium]|nr:hypothetical protein [Parachlamydiales bacterium]